MSEKKIHEDTGVEFTVRAEAAEDQPGQFIGYWHCHECDDHGGSSVLESSADAAMYNAASNFHGHAITTHGDQRKRA